MLTNLILTMFAIFSFAAGATLSLPWFSSPDGGEYEVSFDATFETRDYTFPQLQKMSMSEKDQLVQESVVPIMDYLFGPLTRRDLGGPRRSRDVVADWSQMREQGGRIFIPYHYRGTWILDRAAARGFTIPVPLNLQTVFTQGWLNCTDSDPEHQTRSFYWYFWDPSRPGCDQREGINFIRANVNVGRQTPNQVRTYPEYTRMLRDDEIKLTMAFGYVEDQNQPVPETDSDYGVHQYRQFLREFRREWGDLLQEEPIYQQEYLSAPNPDLIIGRRFQGKLNGTRVTMNIVINAGIDQMEIFAKSFAHDHDDVFAWFGHSRVGSGFDANTFGRLVAQNPNYYSITTEYQAIYWAGCNSYSYYTVPFFKFKADASKGLDPQGTKNLDIIANGLPSLFALNSKNAMIVSTHLLNWKNRSSYQTILAEIKAAADTYDQKVLVAVLGDEDNEP